jgi:diguanylate cyclase (GGDEF) domain
MYFAIYAEISVICIIPLLFILRRMRLNVDQQTANVAFERTVVALIVILTLDAIWTFIEGRPGTGMRRLNCAINACYMLDSGIVGFCWWQFTECKLRPGARLGRDHFWLLAPLAALAVLSVASLWTGWLFRIDADNNYHRGPVHFLQIVLAFSYVVIALADVLRSRKKAVTYQEKLEVRNLLSFFFLPVVGCAASGVVEGLPGIWPCCMLSLAMVFISYQDDSIASDGLTGLNNRLSLDRELYRLTQDPPRRGTAFLFLLDVNHFKHINDTFGHYEGDQALIEVSGLLRRVLEGRDFFAARYGGDEFAIVGVLSDQAEAEGLRGQIYRAFAERNAAGGRAYALNVSAGFEEFGPGGADSVPSLIKGADRMLYREKAGI